MNPKTLALGLQADSPVWTHSCLVTVVLSDDHWTMSGLGYYHWIWPADWLFGLTLALPHYHALPRGSGLLAELGSHPFSLIILLGTVGLGIGWSGRCFADHVFMPLRGQLTSAAPWQVEGRSFICIALIQGILNVRFLFYCLISVLFLAPSLPSSVMILSSKLLETKF